MSKWYKSTDKKPDKPGRYWVAVGGKVSEDWFSPDDVGRETVVFSPITGQYVTFRANGWQEHDGHNAKTPAPEYWMECYKPKAPKEE